MEYFATRRVNINGTWYDEGADVTEVIGWRKPFWLVAGWIAGAPAAAV